MRFAKTGFGLALALLAGVAVAQVPEIEAGYTLSWVLPTTTVDGQPFKPGTALKEVRVFVRNQPIADSDNVAFISLPPTATTYSGTMKVPQNSTLYFRTKMCNDNCSDYSVQVSKKVTVAISPKPNPATGGTMKITVTVTVPPQ